MRKLWCALMPAALLVSGCQSATQSEPEPSAPVDAGDAQTVADAGQPDAAAPGPELTWHKDVRALVEERCANCHQPGEIGPFELTDYESVYAFRHPVAASVESGSMPPWQPAKGCNDYHGDYSLTDAERQTLLDWVDSGAPEGDPADYVAPELPEVGLSRTDLTISMPVDYIPRQRPDDYRCFLIDWPEQEERFVTGFAVDPGNAKMVHHVIAFLVEPRLVERFRRRDAEEEGPGYTCFGGPGELGRGVNWLGSWAPGGRATDLPAGTGIAIPPGSLVAMQVHYNTLTDEPESDRTQIRFRLDDAVEKPSMWLPWTNPFWVNNRLPMSIPAGQAGVRHTFMYDPTTAGLPFGEGRAFEIHRAGVHMHLLGKKIRLSVQRADGSNTCVEDVQDWDFNWQGSVDLVEPVRFDPGDQVRVDCEWDNTPERQPVVDGQRIEPRDVIWGEGTTDEMCLGLLYVSPVD